MTTIKNKWSGLTKEQRQQVTSFYKDELSDKKAVALNQRVYRVNPTNGNVIFFKDF